MFHFCCFFSHECQLCARKFSRKEHYVRHKCYRLPNKSHLTVAGETVLQDMLYVPTLPDLSPRTSPPSPPQIKPDVDCLPRMLPSFSPLHENMAVDNSVIDHQPELEMNEKKFAQSFQITHESRRKSSKPRKLWQDLATNGGIKTEIVEIADEAEEVSIDDEICESGTDGRNECSRSDADEYDSDCETYNRNASHLVSNDNADTPGNIICSTASSKHIPPAVRKMLESVSSVEERRPKSKLHGSSPNGNANSRNSSNQNLDEKPDPSFMSIVPTCVVDMSLDSFGCESEYSAGRKILPSRKHAKANSSIEREMDSALHYDEKNYAGSKHARNNQRLHKDAHVEGDGTVSFACPHCTKTFHRSSNFSRHMRIHRGVYSYVCATCARGFFRREHFAKHKCHRRSLAIRDGIARAKFFGGEEEPGAEGVDVGEALLDEM